MMMSIARMAIILSLATFAMPLAACPQPLTPTFPENLSKATRIYVFRVISLELADDGLYISSVRGRINVIRTLKGDTPTASGILYPTGVCCAPKLAVGRYYLAAVTEDTPVLELVRGDQSFIDVSDDFQYPGGAGKYGAIEPVQQFLIGQALPQDFPGYYRLESTVSCPAMPGGT